MLNVGTICFLRCGTRNASTARNATGLWIPCWLATDPTRRSIAARATPSSSDPKDSGSATPPLLYAPEETRVFLSEYLNNNNVYLDLKKSSSNKKRPNGFRFKASIASLTFFLTFECVNVNERGHRAHCIVKFSSDEL